MSGRHYLPWSPSGGRRPRDVRGLCLISGLWTPCRPITRMATTCHGACRTNRKRLICQVCADAIRTECKFCTAACIVVRGVYPVFNGIDKHNVAAFFRRLMLPVPVIEEYKTDWLSTNTVAGMSFLNGADGSHTDGWLLKEPHICGRAPFCSTVPGFREPAHVNFHFLILLKSFLCIKRTGANAPACLQQCPQERGKARTAYMGYVKKFGAMALMLTLMGGAMVYQSVHNRPDVSAGQPPRYQQCVWYQV